MRSSKFRALVLLTSLLAMTSTAHAAAGTTGVSFGGFLGATIPSQTGASGRFAWGLEGNFEVLTDLSVGAYFLTSSQDNSVPPVISSQRISVYGAQGRFALAAVPGLSLGARMGLSRSSFESTGPGTASSTDFSLGPFGALDYEVMPQLTVGGDVGILFVTTSSSYNIINLLGTIKYWF